MPVEAEAKNRISRRKFFKAGAGFFLLLLDSWMKSQGGEMCDQWDEEREETGGYKTHMVGKQGRIIELLDSGGRECASFGYKYIDKETLKRALRKIDDDDCQIGNIEIWEEQGLLFMHTRGLVLSGVNCGDEEYTGKYRP